MGYVEWIKDGQRHVLGESDDRANISVLICQMCNEPVPTHEYGYDGHQWACKRCKAIND